MPLTEQSIDTTHTTTCSPYQWDLGAFKNVFHITRCLNQGFLTTGWIELDAEVGLALAWMVYPDTNDMLDKNLLHKHMFTSASWKFAACFLAGSGNHSTSLLE
jgi:hypothetical protein